MSEIIFTNIKDWPIKEEYYPAPSKNSIPDWYKITPSYLSDKKSINTSTVKKCMPFFDAMTSGYIIYLPSSVYVYRLKNGSPCFEVKDKYLNLFLIEYHGSDQVEKYLNKKDEAIPKIVNPWSIKTENGYSCFIVNPLHRKSPLRIFEGIVDTDTFTTNINFPFILEDGFEGEIEEGTPVAQVIPFKRESYSMKIGEEKEKNEAFLITRDFGLYEGINKYKKEFWEKKEYN